MKAQTLAHSRAANGQKLHVDWTACDGRGLCVELLPELLGRDEWGYPVPLTPRGSAVPAGLLGVASDAVAACPKRALKLLPR
ncbi:MAG: oxidoreductase [Mycobacterium sp.]|jgi:ferredoxin|nr:oxidoreductase [Mycobacterium sp.]